MQKKWQQASSKSQEGGKGHTDIIKDAAAFAQGKKESMEGAGAGVAALSLASLHVLSSRQTTKDTLVVLVMPLVQWVDQLSKWPHSQGSLGIQLFCMY